MYILESNEMIPLHRLYKLHINYRVLYTCYTWTMFTVERFILNQSGGVVFDNGVRYSIINSRDKRFLYEIINLIVDRSIRFRAKSH